MRYQERIYIQNDNRAVRNKDILNVNMSSDICIFKSPSFDISAATKIQCGPIICNLSGFSAENILSAATNDCPTIQISGDCFSSVTWTTKIYEDNELSYSNSYYTALSLTGDTPPNQTYFDSLTKGLFSLGYSYTFENYLLTVEKLYGGAKELQYDLCLTWGLKPTISSCPVGFSATPANDACQKVTTSAATSNGTGGPILSGNQDTSYANYGTYFYPSIKDDQALPVYYVGNFNDLKDQTGGTITAVNIVNTGNPFWENHTSTMNNGRLNNIGLSASSTEWLGFSKCIDILSAGTYYIGIGADNDARFKVDGIMYVNFSGSAEDSFKKWSVFPFYLESGLHIIEMEGLNDTSVTSFGAEVYNPINFDTLVAATSTGASEANAIFSTAEYIGGEWQIGTTVGYTCSTGYSLNICNGVPLCSLIENAPISAVTCTACSEDCTTICSDTFPYIDNTSQGVYIIDTDVATTTIPITFNFTGNTNSFSAYNANFKYKIYKYNSTSGVFKLPAVYESDTISYLQFSGVSGYSLTESIPLSGISLDGDYLIKGFYVADACTDFLQRLGKKIDTTSNDQGSISQVYQEELDYYFAAITKADVPYFTYSQGNDEVLPAGGISLYQQVIIVDDVLSPQPPLNPSVPYQSNPNDVTIPQYYRTGSTFALNTTYAGGVAVTLNGLTLAKDIDYTLTGQSLTLIGPVTNGDIITIIYTKTSNTPIVAQSILLDTTIPSGTTNNQGSNKYYFNTTTGKYEIYLDNTPFAQSNIIVTLNGVTLSTGIDFYQSTTNSKRIILEGILMVGDIITIIYYPTVTVVNGITTTNNYINWYVNTPPQKVNGTFYLEYSPDSAFSTYTISSTVPYIEQLTSYSGVLTLTGSVGTNLYYRVRNVKDYASICGDIISSTAYSETVKVKIQSNAINSY